MKSYEYAFLRMETVACYIYLSERKTFRTKDKEMSEAHSIFVALGVST
jgi:hypothetical protein